jgi:hypothetical protein
MHNIYVSIKECAQERAEFAFHPKWADTPNMIAMFLRDAADMMKVAQFIKKGEYEKAREKAWSMDTAARDYIPDEFWDMVKG